LNLASKSPFDKHYAAPAGVNKSAHGLRKIGATRAANNGATVAALNSIFGWSGSKMASLYTANADRARLSRDHGQDANKVRRT
jgi:integrase